MYDMCDTVVVHKTGNLYFNSLALSFSSSCLKIMPLVIVSSFLSRTGKTGEGLVERGHCQKTIYCITIL